MNDKDFLKQLGLRLKCAIVMAETSTSAVAKKCGLADATIQRMMRGAENFHIINLKKVTDAIGIEVKDLL